MEKIEFTYQRFNLRVGMSLLLFPIIQIIKNVILRPLGISDGLYITLGAMITVGGLMLYYRWTENSSLFLKKGYYWEENGIVFIQRGKKIRAVNNVDWLRGTETSAYGVRAAVLVVQCGKKKTLVFSKPIEDNIDFSNTELYPIYKLILENNPRLEENPDFTYWYEVKNKDVIK